MTHSDIIFFQFLVVFLLKSSYGGGNLFYLSFNEMHSVSCDLYCIFKAVFDECTPEIINMTHISRGRGLWKTVTCKMCKARSKQKVSTYILNENTQGSFTTTNMMNYCSFLTHSMQ